MEREDLWEGIHALCWKRHGGSGTNLTRSEIIDLEIDEFNGWIRYLNETREAEYKALNRRR